MKNYWLALCAFAFSLSLVGVVVASQPGFSPNMFKRDSSGNLMVTCRATPAPSDKRANGFWFDSSGNLIITNCAVGTPLPTPTPAPTATPVNPGTHVKTLAYGYGYGGISTSVPIATQALWLTLAYQGSGASNAQYQQNGVKTIAYKNFWACYPTDSPKNCWFELAPLSVCQADAGQTKYGNYSASSCTARYASQEAVTGSSCNTPIVDNNATYGTGYVNDPSNSITNFAQIASDQTGSVPQNYLFSDDTMVNFNQSPCNPS